MHRRHESLYKWEQNNENSGGKEVEGVWKEEEEGVIRG